MTGIDKAVLAAGGQKALADKLGVKQQMVSRYVLQGHVPASRVVEVSTLTGVPKAELIDPKLKDLLED